MLFNYAIFAYIVYRKRAFKGLNIEMHQLKDHVRPPGKINSAAEKKYTESA